MRCLTGGLTIYLYTHFLLLKIFVFHVSLPGIISFLINHNAKQPLHVSPLSAWQRWHTKILSRREGTRRLTVTESCVAVILSTETVWAGGSLLIWFRSLLVSAIYVYKQTKFKASPLVKFYVTVGRAWLLWCPEGQTKVFWVEDEAVW